MSDTRITLRERLNNCKFEGDKAEDHFKQLMEARGYFVLPATKEQNIKDHVDFWVDHKDINEQQKVSHYYGVDVKGNRHLDCIWLEIKNVLGNKGWLEGEAEYIVFDIKELKGFCFYRRTDLLDYCQKITKYAQSKEDYNKFYTRSGRKDKLVKVKHKHIKHLQKGIIKYESNR
tara:strand:+ start:15 stop:536 length:522 start_codon:yes stop_codon:yes gene_type:complete